ncbi:L,D-transpeptidase family protein [uncultured Microbacterium sp.]|uniref:L,D-transpeptidase family protein n=1 Tax=uncultured Microbacterium sp. TaxID=191216 RepID=UPI0026008C37|nr:L,D-transpeptidase family protein [uncultured Microbacterium sp.]
MTDPATGREAEGSPDASSASPPTAATAVLDGPIETIDDAAVPPAQVPPLQWAPAEPPRKKKRLWLWIGVPAAVVAAGAVTASLVLIAPGTAIAGVPVGFLTAGAATDAISQRLGATTVVLGEGGPTVTAAQLGATVDAHGLADRAFAARPMWNVTQWFGDGLDAPVTLDADRAEAALRAALPSAFTAPVPAQVSFTGTAYTMTPAVAGTGLDLDAIAAAVHDAFVAGKSTVTVSAASVPVAAPATSERAQSAADQLNGMLQTIGFYVGDERTVPIDPATAASWLTVTPDASGAFSITADAAKIQAAVDALPAAVNRAPANGTVITNSDGTVLETSVPGADGRTLGDTSAVAKEFAAQLDAGKAAFALPVTLTPASTVTLQRLLEVNLSEQMLYLKENGAVVDSWPISSGVAQSPTYTGHFRINSHIRSQTMTSTDPNNPYWNYDVPNVEWVMYFNGDEAFHGVYWHNNFGTPQSHGCVGMPNYRAKQIYDWSPTGVDVWIHD